MPARIRKVRWTELPLGSIVLEGPRLFHGWVPELAHFPVITERLRAELTRRYQLGPRVMVTIADPADEPLTWDVPVWEAETRRWLAGLPPLIELKRASRTHVLTQLDAREGVASMARWETTPYTLLRHGLRSWSAVLRDDQPFGSAFAAGPWDGVGEVLGRLLAGQLPRLPAQGADIDVGIDASYSMTLSGKTEFVQREWATVLVPALQRLGVTEAKVQTFGTRDETLLAPFLRSVMHRDRPGVPHLCLVITDGQCQDRAESLRLLERLGRLGVEYHQILLWSEDDFREYVVGPHDAHDGVVDRDGLAEGATVVTRDEDEWAEAQAQALAQATDAAEAARGGQLVVNWTPAFRLVTLDVYEQYLGRLVAGTSAR